MAIWRPRIGSLRRSRGIALVAVLWVIALLSTIAVSFVGSIRTETALTRNLVDNANAQALADAGVYRAVLALYRNFEEAVAEVETDQPEPDGPLAELYEAARTAGLEPLDGARDLRADGRTYVWPFRGGVLRIAIQNEAGKVDLNAARDELLLGLLRAYGVVEAETLRDRIIDFRDADKEALPLGAEDPAYEAAGRPYGAKDAPFSSVEELQQVLGMNRAVYDRLAPALTVFSEARGIDPLTAPAAALKALPDIEDATVEAIMAERLAEEPDLATLLADYEAYLAGPGALVYTIHSEAALPGGARFRREAVVALVPGAERPFRIFGWKRGRIPVQAGS